MKINKKVVVFAVIVGLITVAMLYQYITSLKEETLPAVNLTTVVTAVNTIPKHVVIKEEMLTTITLPSEAIHPEAVLDSSLILGGITSSEIIKGEQLLKSRVVTEGDDSSLGYRIPENMRAITIPTNEISGVGGYIVPGDTIDILVSYSEPEISPKKITYTQLQNIEVIKIGPYNQTEEQNEGIVTSLTVLVTPEQAEVIAFANVNGTFHFTLRNPMDDKKEEVEEYGSENFNTWRDR
ncbi:MAG: hypothetical protein K0R21_1439 [Anaerocolumna sp.]|jgi:pilus assembly protein CpaB|nr:hypothetical protein [Anaerocolumna sp.]